MRQISFQTKLSIMFITLLVFILAVTTYFIYQRAVIQQKENLRNRILGLVKLASMLIDGDRHTQIKPEIASKDTPTYKEIKNVLNKIRDIDPIVDSVYTMVRSDRKNIWKFIVDSGDKRGVSAYCGEDYDVSGFPQMQLAFDGPSVDKELSQDKWGVFLSSYAPIYNLKKETVAIVGLDVTADSIRKMQLLLAKRVLWVLVSGVLFSLLLGWYVARSITYPLRRLILGVREVGRGNLRHKVVLNSWDELEGLALSFNKMTEELLQSQNRLHRYYLETIKSLAKALEAKDPYTKGHSERVAHYAVNIAKLLQFSEKEMELLEDICILHDIGKIGIPEGILSKATPLSEEEWRIIKIHPKIGEDILKPIEFLKPVLSVVRNHHEQPDGKGYPEALKGGEISQLASIVKVADAFDAMISDRPYRKALTKEEALLIIQENRGSQFDSRIVEVFIEFLIGTDTNLTPIY